MAKNLVVERQRVAQQRLFEQLGVEFLFYLLKERFTEKFGEVFSVKSP